MEFKQIRLSTVKAKKEHTCTICLHTIPVGTIYLYEVGVHGGKFRTCHWHLKKDCYWP